jgi:hypothetical protein
MRKSIDCTFGGGGFLRPGGGIVGSNRTNLPNGRETSWVSATVFAFGSIFRVVGGWWAGRFIEIRRDGDLSPTTAAR